MFWGFVGYLPGVRRQNSCAWGSQCHEMAAALGLESGCFQTEPVPVGVCVGRILEVCVCVGV